MNNPGKYQEKDKETHRFCASGMAGREVTVGALGKRRKGRHTLERVAVRDDDLDNDDNRYTGITAHTVSIMAGAWKNCKKPGG